MLKKALFCLAVTAASLFAASRAEGIIRAFGRALGIWALFIALLFPVMGAYVSVSGTCPIPGAWESVDCQPDR